MKWAVVRCRCCLLGFTREGDLSNREKKRLESCTQSNQIRLLLHWKLKYRHKPWKWWIKSDSSRKIESKNGILELKVTQNDICLINPIRFVIIFSHRVPICLHFYLPPFTVHVIHSFSFSSLKHGKNCEFQWSHFVASPLCNSARRHLFPQPKWNSINFESPNCFLHHFKFITYIYFELVCFLLFSCTPMMIFLFCFVLMSTPFDHSTQKSAPLHFSVPINSSCR